MRGKTAKKGKKSALEEVVVEDLLSSTPPMSDSDDPVSKYKKHLTDYNLLFIILLM